MKLKDLPENQRLFGLVIQIPKKTQIAQNIPSKKMYIYSGWNKGLWLKEKKDDERIFPLTFDKFEDIENYKVISKIHLL